MKTFGKTMLCGGIIAAALLSSCKKNGNEPGPQNNKGMFKVTIENTFAPKKFFASGVFNIPVGSSSPAPIFGGQKFTFSFHAPKGSKLSLAAMFGQSNDAFFAPDASGIALYSGDAPISGDITSMFTLWDAGTEVNEEPGVGPNQAPRQSAPNTGTSESMPVKPISERGDGYTYPAVNDVIKVTLTAKEGALFEVTIENVSTDKTLNGKPVPVSPGVWVVHTMDGPIFTYGMKDMGKGLENLAEDGNPATLAAYLKDNAGFVSPISPGVWAVHSSAVKPVFTLHQKDYNEGLEDIAERGNPTRLAEALKVKKDVITSGIYNMPAGSNSTGPILPGQKYEFTIMAKKGEYLSIASMLGQSNDIFAGTRDMGVALFKEDGTKVSGDISDMVNWYDAGTEVNEYPGAGPNQGPRQMTPDSGQIENGVVMKTDELTDGFSWPKGHEGIKVTIMPY